MFLLKQLRALLGYGAGTGACVPARSNPKLVIGCVVLVLLVIYITLSALHLSHESWLVVVLNHVATSQPADCPKGTDFQTRHSHKSHQLTLDVSEDGFLVPNVVHFIWYVSHAKDLTFINMLSMLSAYKYIKPTSIYFYCNIEPKGPNWTKVKKSIPVLKIVHQEPVTCVYGTPITNPVFGPSSSDLERVTTLMDKGGIYLDLDVIVVRSFNPLRNYSCTVGLESEVKVNSGVLVAHRNSPFLRLWLEHYIADYKVWMWNYNAGWVPAHLAARYPEYVHIEDSKLQKPNGDEIEKIWGDAHFNWRENYAVHLLIRTWKAKNMFMINEPTLDSIAHSNSTFAQLARRVLY